MSSSNERMTDLFIPIGRSHSTTSTVMTEFSTQTTATSATVPSGSTTPTTASSRKSVVKTTPRTSEGDSPSSIRYTISGPDPEKPTQRSEYIVKSQPYEKTPNPVHFRRHSRNLSVSASPIQELSIRLSRATADSVPKWQTNNTDNIAQQSISTVEATIGGSTVSPTKPTIAPGPLDDFDSASNSSNTEAESQLKSVLTPSKDKKPADVESNAPILAPSLLLRSHSRSSTRSDRSCPPPSFPSDFYGRSADQGIYQSPPRSNIHRTTPSRSRPRSSSPLKHQVNDEDTFHSTAAQSNQSQHGRRPSIARASTLPRRDSYGRYVMSGYSVDSSQNYRTIHYYASCPHSSPPTTRPLNVQPRFDASHNTPRSILAGACFDCDTIDRRDTESLILESYNLRISAHIASLAQIITIIEASSPVSPLSPSTATAHFGNIRSNDSNPLESSFNSQQSTSGPMSRRGSSSSSVSEDDETTPVTVRIEVLQHRIAELTMLRDREVKDLWKGYTQRWGPGTLGVVKAIYADETGIRTPERVESTRTSIDSDRSQYGTGEGRMKVDWIRNGS